MYYSSPRSWYMMLWRSFYFESLLTFRSRFEIWIKQLSMSANFNSIVCILFKQALFARQSTTICSISSLFTFMCGKCSGCRVSRQEFFILIFSNSFLCPSKSLLILLFSTFKASIELSIKHILCTSIFSIISINSPPIFIFSNASLIFFTSLVTLVKIQLNSLMLALVLFFSSSMMRIFLCTSDTLLFIRVSLFSVFILSSEYSVRLMRLFTILSFTTLNCCSTSITFMLNQCQSLETLVSILIILSGSKFSFSCCSFILFTIFCQNQDMESLTYCSVIRDSRAFLHSPICHTVFLSICLLFSMFQLTDSWTCCVRLLMSRERSCWIYSILPQRYFVLFWVSVGCQISTIFNLLSSPLKSQCKQLMDVLTAPSFLENYLAAFLMGLDSSMGLLSLLLISLSRAVSISISVDAKELASATEKSAGLFQIYFLSFSISFFCAV